MISNKFDLGLGKLTTRHADGSGPVEFEFCAYDTGKLYVLKLTQTELEAQYEMFRCAEGKGFGVILDAPEKAERKGADSIELVYHLPLPGMRMPIVIHVPEKIYPAGTDAKLIELECVNRIQTHTIDMLNDLLQDKNAKMGKSKAFPFIDCSTFIGSCSGGSLYSSDPVNPPIERMVVHVPFDKLIPTDADAQKFMYRDTRSFGIFAVSEMSYEQKLLFNLHWLNRVNGCRIVAAIELYWRASEKNPTHPPIQTSMSSGGGCISLVCSTTQKKYVYALMSDVAMRDRMGCFDNAVKIMVPHGGPLSRDKDVDDNRYEYDTLHIVQFAYPLLEDA